LLVGKIKELRRCLENEYSYLYLLGFIFLFAFKRLYVKNPPRLTASKVVIML